jgi:tetratricopeptide (TPR) repeat protein
MNRHSLEATADRARQQRCQVVPSNSREAKVNLASIAESDSELRRQAQAKAQQGDYAEAISVLSQLIDRHPHDAVNYNNRGLVYFQSNQLDRANADYNTAIQLNPQLASAYNNRANYHAACKCLEAAIADYDRAIDLNPSYVRAWINRAITLRDLGKYEQAVEDLDIAEVLGQLEGHVYAERGRTYHLWGDWNCAIADYRRALNHPPQNSHSNFELAERLRLQVETWLDQLLTPLQA